MVQIIVVENQSSVINDLECRRIIWALNVQNWYHFRTSPWGIKARAKILTPGEKPPVGSWNLIIEDTPSQVIEEGVLGYHTDTEGTNIPYSEVFAKTALDNNESVSAVASHELCEQLVNPFVNKTVMHDERIYPIEVCDPCENSSYDVGELQGVKTGIMVADFVYPSWFGLGPESARFSYRNSVHNPFELASGGYVSTAPILDPTNFTETFGSKINKLPPWASRLPRIKAF